MLHYVGTLPHYCIVNKNYGQTHKQKKNLRNAASQGKGIFFWQTSEWNRGRNRRKGEGEQGRYKKRKAEKQERTATTVWAFSLNFFLRKDYWKVQNIAISILVFCHSLIFNQSCSSTWENKRLLKNKDMKRQKKPGSSSGQLNWLVKSGQ